jgi:hypothetical protein
MSGEDGEADESGINITLGKLIAYPIGILLILSGVGAFASSTTSGVLILAAGIVSLPIVRSKLKQSQGIGINRWATLGIVIVLLIAGGAAMGSVDEAGMNNGSDQAEDGGQTQADNDQVDQLTHGMNESFVVGGDGEAIEYTVENAYTTEYISGFDLQETDGQFIAIELEMLNVGDETYDITDRHLVLLDSQDREFEADNEAMTWAGQDSRFRAEPINFEQLSPGVSTSGLVVYEIPADESELRLRIEPTGFFSGADEHTVELEIESLE